MKQSRGKRHSARQPGLVQQLKALWISMVGARSSSSRSNPHRRTSFHPTHAVQYRSRSAFKEGLVDTSVGREDTDSVTRLSRRRMALVAFAVVGLVWIGWRIVVD